MTYMIDSALITKNCVIGGGTAVNLCQQRAIGAGNNGVPGSIDISGVVHIGGMESFSRGEATLMVEESDYQEGDAAAYFLGKGSHVNSISPDNTVIIDGDLHVTGDVDCGYKGKLLARFEAADDRPKPFDMKHPSQEGWRLRYACIEGPEVGVYFRGRLRNKKEIDLPDYWKDLVHENSITVQLQPIGAPQNIIIKRWDSEKVYLQSNTPIDCFYHVYAERKDVNALITEYEGDTWEDYPDKNYDSSLYKGVVNTQTM